MYICGWADAAAALPAVARSFFVNVVGLGVLVAFHFLAVVRACGNVGRSGLLGIPIIFVGL